ncbi:Ig-like domain-containing domain [Algoriphagus halophilus]|uniref:Polysaccharide lyase family 4, domain II n=1 Tax=Algoriphagus halophilus TaxID=226505 RepID=A0A1N6GCX4_9BACT|nr:Ig-like domain-containing domain [Algoriphagus halophilus]SIO05388.1 Polysaccharide lyase family 4, domain II [Algoriphagus halophilus]
MKYRLYISFLFLAFLFYACAKQSTPMGGPRDQDPPVVLEMFPSNQSLNQRPEEILIVFDEYIKLDNPNKNIIITPKVDKDELVITALKNTVKIELNQDLEDSTTYVFNFQKSIEDLSEGNPTENLKLVFSTGETIDSLKFSGKVNNYFPKRGFLYENVIIGLYESNDTTDVFTAPPYYLSQADSLGNFSIENIKAGKYRAYAWHDDNNSLKAEYKSEAYDFILDTIDIQDEVSGAIFNLSNADQTQIKLTRSSTSGGNYDLVLNKDPLEIELANERIGKDIFYIVTDKKITLYSTQPIQDSVKIDLQLQDSLSFKVDTTIYAKFEESKRRAEKLTYTVNSGKNFYQDLLIELTFNKPIADISYDSLYIAYDTAFQITITPEMISFQDSMKRDQLNIQLIIPDSLTTDIVTIKAADSTFRDIEGQFNEAVLAANYRKLKRETLADELSGQIVGATAPYIVQLIDSKSQIIKELYITEGNEFKFELLEPITYKIRVIEDLNKNRHWDPSNYLEERYAERVFYYVHPDTNSQDIVIKSGWITEDLTIEATPKTGLN